MNLRGRFTAAMESCLDEGALYLDRIKVSLRKRIQWRSLPLSILSLPSDPVLESPQMSATSPDNDKYIQATSFLNNFRILCPSCFFPRSAARLAPQTNRNTWRQLLCTNCHHSNPAHKWHCTVSSNPLNGLGAAFETITSGAVASSMGECTQLLLKTRVPTQ